MAEQIAGPPALQQVCPSQNSGLVLQKPNDAEHGKHGPLDLILLGGSAAAEPGRATSTRLQVQKSVDAALIAQLRELSFHELDQLLSPKQALFEKGPDTELAEDLERRGVVQTRLEEVLHQIREARHLAGNGSYASFPGLSGFRVLCFGRPRVFRIRRRPSLKDRASEDLKPFMRPIPGFSRSFPGA